MTQATLTEKSDTHFREKQNFDQLWRMVLVGSLSALEIGTSAYALWQQLVQKRPWGDRPMSDAGLIALSTVMIGSGLAMPALLRSLHLTVEAEENGLAIYFPPFVHRKIPWHEIESAEVRTYSPLKEYGGWGIRYGLSGKAYNVSGNRGVQLQLKNGEKLLIGSQRADELAGSIQQAMGS